VCSGHRHVFSRAGGAITESRRALRVVGVGMSALRRRLSLSSVAWSRSRTRHLSQPVTASKRFSSGSRRPSGRGRRVTSATIRYSLRAEAIRRLVEQDWPRSSAPNPSASLEGVPPWARSSGRLWAQKARANPRQSKAASIYRSRRRHLIPRRDCRRPLDPTSGRCLQRQLRREGYAD
jgi:hypothetical protein